jgi:hypothetical protein
MKDDDPSKGFGGSGRHTETGTGWHQPVYASSALRANRIYKKSRGRPL